MQVVQATYSVSETGLHNTVPDYFEIELYLVAIFNDRSCTHG